MSWFKSSRAVAVACLFAGSFLFACGDNLGAQLAVCGNAKLEGAEACDDGNTADGDGCDSNCTVTACGNGIMTMNEGCDDGNTIDGDGCDNNCVASGCGNGAVGPGETCDDGNTVNGDGCDNNCTATACGNGVMSAGEICDDGNATDGDGCDRNCTVTGCGNGVMAGTEQCDDGNVVSADGCSAACTLETLEKEPNEDGTISTGGTGIAGNDFASANADTNGAYTGSVTILAALTPAGDEDVYKFTNSGTAIVKVRFDVWNRATGFGIGMSCGTTSIDTGLNIRDAAGARLASNADRSATDYCSGLSYGLAPGASVYAHVVWEGDDTAAPAYALQATYSAVVCGDGDIGPTEQCDDSNTIAGDGCSATCQLEGATSEIEPNEDGTPSLGGSTTNGNDFASTNADTNGAFTSNATITGSIKPAGDEDVFAIKNTGTTVTQVKFDVWNLASGYGIGVPCGTAIDTALRIRNAAGTSLQLNDDRNGATDRCSALTYPLPAGQTVYAHLIAYGDADLIQSYALKVVFTPVVCGDGAVGPGETCDDGNTTAGDGCSPTCQIEVVCGDGTVGAGEQCDDGNTTNGDGCSSTCQLEVVCGDGTRAGSEQCDDGNTTNGDGCSATCQVEGVSETEPNDDGSVSTGTSSTTGNDFLASAANGPFTASTTLLGSISPIGDEDEFAFTNSGVTASVLKLDLWNLAPGFGINVPCGTSIDTYMHVRNAAGTSLASNDDRNGATDRCSTITYTLPAGQTVYAHVLDLGDNSLIPQYALRATLTPVVCGDGAIGPGEQCDDGNATAGDGCSATCQIEVVCGDGAVGAGEQCDDGNTTSGDGCSSACQIDSILTEVEPNGTTVEADASTVQISGTAVIQGAIGVVGDRDVYKVTVATDTTVRFETFTSLLDCTTGATIDLRLLSSLGTSITTDTGGSGIANCGAIVYFLPAGTYYIQVEERGNNALVANYYLQVAFQSDKGTETEPNETVMQPSLNFTSVGNAFVSGDHTVNADVDVYAITVPAGGKIRAEVIEGVGSTETCESNGIDSRLTLFDKNGVQLGDDDDSGRGFCSKIDGTGSVPASAAAHSTSGTPQTFYLMVRASSFASTTPAGVFVYRLQVTVL